MSDLISRKAVYDMLHGLGGCDANDEWSNGWDKAIDSAIKELDKIPTAYDVDKVVENLEALHRFYVYSNDVLVSLSKVAAAVKGGGQG